MYWYLFLPRPYAEIDPKYLHLARKKLLPEEGSNPNAIYTLSENEPKIIEMAQRLQWEEQEAPLLRAKEEEEKRKEMEQMLARQKEESKKNAEFTKTYSQTQAQKLLSRVLISRIMSPLHIIY
jgi:hypothetical protein